VVKSSSSAADWRLVEFLKQIGREHENIGKNKNSAAQYLMESIQKTQYKLKLKLTVSTLKS